MCCCSVEDATIIKDADNKTSDSSSEEKTDSPSGGLLSVLKMADNKYKVRLTGIDILCYNKNSCIRGVNHFNIYRTRFFIFQRDVWLRRTRFLITSRVFKRSDLPLSCFCTEDEHQADISWFL